jgi:hypothetical protein
MLGAARAMEELFAEGSWGSAPDPEIYRFVAIRHL